MMSASTARSKAMAIASSTKDAKTAVEDAIQAGMTNVTLNYAIPKKYAELLTVLGYDVFVYDNPRQAKFTVIDFSESCSGKITYATDFKEVATKS